METLQIKRVSQLPPTPVFFYTGVTAPSQVLNMFRGRYNCDPLAIYMLENGHRWGWALPDWSLVEKWRRHG